METESIIGDHIYGLHLLRILFNSLLVLLLSLAIEPCLELGRLPFPELGDDLVGELQLCQSLFPWFEDFDFLVRPKLIRGGPDLARKVVVRVKLCHAHSARTFGQRIRNLG